MLRINKSPPPPVCYHVNNLPESPVPNASFTSKHYNCLWLLSWSIQFLCVCHHSINWQLDCQQPTRLHHHIPLIPAISDTMHRTLKKQHTLLLSHFVLSHTGTTGDDCLDKEGDKMQDSSLFLFLLFTEFSLCLLRIPEVRALPGSEDTFLGPLLSWMLFRWEIKGGAVMIVDLLLFTLFHWFSSWKWQGDQG